MPPDHEAPSGAVEQKAKCNTVGRVWMVEMQIELRVAANHAAMRSRNAPQEIRS